MGRRRRDASLSDVLLHSPWWLSLMLAIGSYIALDAIVPSVLAANPYLAAIAMLSRGLAWIPATMFAFIALLSYLRERRRVQAEGSVRKPSLKPSDAMSARSARGQNRSTSAVSSTDTVPNLPSRTNRIRASKPAPANESVPGEINGWSLDALMLLEWKRFEMLCVWYYQQKGFTVKTVPHGPDGGIDATLYKDGLTEPIAVVQCKAWAKPVKVEPVRALGGVMLENNVKRGVFWSRSGYVGRPVRSSAERAGIQLLDGAAIVERILALDQHQQAALFAQAFEGDYRTPTCAACGVKLLPRVFKGRPIWGCRNYPSCRSSFFRAE